MTTVEPVNAPILNHLVTLVDCLCAELEANGAGPTCWCGLYPGALPSLEFCSECEAGRCGMGYVRVASVFPSDQFPLPTIDPNCRKALAWQIEVGALRCIPVAEDIPSPEAMAEVWLSQYLDTMAMYNALTCCGLPIVSVQTYTPIGPDGGCVGGYWTAYISEF